MKHQFYNFIPPTSHLFVILHPCVFFFFFFFKLMSSVEFYSLLPYSQWLKKAAQMLLDERKRSEKK